MARTRDGLKLGRIIKALEQLKGVQIRAGSNHPYIAKMQGYPILCPIAASTDAKRMIVPWIKQACGYSDSNNIYKALKSGDGIRKWNKNQ